MKIFKAGQKRFIVNQYKGKRKLSLLMVMFMLLNTINVEAISLWNQGEDLDIGEAVDLESELAINGGGEYDGQKLSFENNSIYAGASAFTRDKYSLDSLDEGMSFATTFAFSIDHDDESFGKGGFAFMVKASDNEEYSKAENTLGTGGIEKSLAIGIEPSYWDFGDDSYTAYTLSVIQNGDYANPIFQDTTANIYLDKPIEDGEVVRTYIAYDDQAKGLCISIDGMQLRNSDVSSFDVPNIDLSSILSDGDEVIKDVYIGFTGATGDADETCSIHDWYFDNTRTFTDDFYERINANAIEDYKWLEEHLYTDILNGNNSFDQITHDLYLPSKLPLGTKIVWKSYAPLLIDNRGNVNRPFVDDDGIESGLGFYIINPLGLVIDKDGNEIDEESDYIGFTVLRNDENLEGEKINTAVYMSSGADATESLKSFGGGELKSANTIAIKKKDDNNLEGSVFTANRLFFADDYSFSTYFSFNDASLETDRGKAGTGGFAFNILGNGNQLGDAEGFLGTNNMTSSLNIGIVSKYEWKTRPSSTSQGEYYCDKNYYLSVFKNGDYNNPLLYEEIEGPYIGSGKDIRCEINYYEPNKRLSIKMIQSNYIGGTAYYYTYEKTLEDIDLTDLLIDEDENKIRAAFVGFSGGTASIDQTFNIKNWFFASGNTDIYETLKELEDTSLMDISLSDIDYASGRALKIKVAGSPDSDGKPSPVQGAKVDISSSAGQVYPSQIITDSLGEGECIILSENDVDATISVEVHGGIFKEKNIAVAGYGSELEDSDMLDVAYHWLNEEIIKNGNTSINDIRTDVEMPQAGPFASVITWTISDENIVDDSGSVTRPEEGDGNANVTLGAKISLGEASIEKSFDLKISEKTTSYGLLLDEDYDSLTEEIIAKDNRSLDQVMSDLYLPTLAGNGSSIEWESSAYWNVSTSGKVNYFWFSEDAHITLTASLTMGEKTRTKEFHVTLHTNPTNDSQILQADYEWFYIISDHCQVSDEDNNVQLQLPSAGRYGSLIEWESSNENIITSDGRVYRPSEGDAYQYVYLTARLGKGSESTESQISVRVKKTEFTQENILDLDYDALNQYVIRNDNSDLGHVETNLNLPTRGEHGSLIVWQSSNDEVISTKGIVNRNAYNEEDQALSLTATISYGTAAPKSKTFEVVVLKNEATDLEAVNEMNQAFDEESFLNGNEDLMHIKSDLNMPTSGVYDTTLVWASSDETVVGNDGKVTRPTFFDNDKQALISLEIKRGEASVKRQYEVSVNKIDYTDDQIVDRDLAALDFDAIKNENMEENSITGNLTLETTGEYGSAISWESSKPEIISASGQVTAPTYLEEDSVVALTATISYGAAVSKVKTFDLTVPKEEITDAQCINEALKSLTNEVILNGNTDYENIISDLSLPTKGLYDTSLSWQSSNTNFIKTNGVVIRPEYSQMDKAVTLTLEIVKGDESETKSYELVVKAEKITDRKAVENAWQYLTYEVILGDLSKNEVTHDINLPTSYDNGVEITWTSSDTGVIKTDGSVIRPKEYNSRGVSVTLNVTITCGTASNINRFYLTVPCIEDDYVKYVTSDPRMSNEDVAYGKKEITVDFDKDINLTKYKDDIKIEKYNEYWGDYYKVASNLTSEDEKLTIILQEGLKIGNKYKVTIPEKSINSDRGYYLINDYVFYFTVEDLKYIGGNIESISIKDGQTNLDIVSQVFDVRFFEFKLEDISDDEIRYFEGDKFSDIKVVNKNTKEEIGLYACMIVGKGLRLGINPLEAGESYRVYIPKGAVVDYYGNPNDEVDISFATREDLASPKIASLYPRDGSENVDINQEIEVNFNKVIRSYDEDKIYIVDDKGNKVDTVLWPILKYSDNTEKYVFNNLYIMGLLIKPVKGLEANKTYHIVIEEEAVRDWGDRNFDFEGEDSYKLSFTTGDTSYDMGIGIDNVYIGTQPDIRLQFDDLIIRGDSSSNISLKNSNGETINARVTYEDKMIKLKPVTGLQSQTQYFIDIPLGAWTYESTGKTNHAYRKMFYTDKSIDEYLFSMDTNLKRSTAFPDDNINFYSGFDVEPYIPGNTKIQDIIKYSWNFGDGSVEEGKNVRHRYGQAGQYTVTLSIDAGPYGSKDLTKKISVLDIDEIDLNKVSVSFKSIGESFDEQEAVPYGLAAVINRNSLEEAYAVFRVNAYLKIYYREMIDLPDAFEMQYQIYKDGQPIGGLVEGTNSTSNREFVLKYNSLQAGSYEVRFTCARDGESVEIGRIPLEIREPFEKDLGIRIYVNNYKGLEDVARQIDYEKNGIDNMPKKVMFNVRGGWWNNDFDVSGEYSDATGAYIIEDLYPGSYTISISEDDPVLKAKGTEFSIDLQNFAYKNIDAWVKYPNEIGIDGGLYVDKEAFLNKLRMFPGWINEESIVNYLDEYISDISAIEGVSRKETFEIDVDWNGHEEGYIQIAAGDRRWNLETFEGKNYTSIDLGSMKVGERLMARAVSYDGEESDWIDLGITCVPLPPLATNETIEYTTYIEPIGDYNIEAGLPFDGYTEGNIPAFDNFSILDKSESFGMGSFNGGLDVSFDGDKATYTIKAEDAQKIKVKSIGREISGGVEVSITYRFNKFSNEWDFMRGFIYMNVVDKETRTVELAKVKIKNVKITPKFTTIITTGIGTKIFIDCSGGQAEMSGIIDLDIGLDVGLDVSLLGTGLEVWGGGTIGAELHIPTWYLQVDGSAYTKEIAKLFTLKYTIYYGDIYGTWNNGKDKVGYASNKAYLSALGMEYGANFASIDRSYIGEDQHEEMEYASLATSYETEEGSDEKILIDNIYPYPELENIEIDGSRWLTYVDDNMSRDSLNRTETCLGHVNEMGIFETIWLDDDGTCDFEPLIAGTDSGALVAWQDLNKYLEGDYDLDGIAEIEKSCEISVTDGVYESLTDEVGQKRLTNDDIYDHSPRLAAEGNNGLLVWQKSDDQGTRLAYSFFDGSNWSDASLVSEEYMSIVNMDIAYNNNKGIAVFTLDADDDFTSEGDREIYGKYYENGLWSESFRLTDNSLMDTEPKCLAVNDDCFVTWLSGEGLSYKWLSKDGINVIDDIGIQGTSYDAEYNQSLDLISLLYKGERKDQKDTLLLRSYDLNRETWSEERLVTSDYDYIRSFDSAIVASGDMVIDFTDVEMRTEVYAGGQILVPSDKVDLKEMTLSFKHDLAIVEAISLSSEVPYKNGEVTIHALLENHGDYSERALVSFYEGDPNSGGKKIGQVDSVDYIPAQGQKEIDLQWIVGSQDKDYYDIYMEIENYNNTMTKKTFMDRISSYNLSITNVAYKSYGEDEYLITAKVFNDSSNPMNNLRIELVDDNGSYSMVKEIETIEALQVYSVDFIIKSSALELGEDIYNIKIIVSPNEELFESNGDDNEYELELEPVELRLLSQSLVDNEVGVKLDEELKLVFNKELVEGSEFDKITLRDYKLNLVDIDRLVSNNELVIQAKELLDYNNQYELIVPKESIEALGGYTMDYDKSIVFYTESNSPQVIFAYPADGLGNVDVDESIRLKFNQSIEKGTNYRDIELTDVAGQSVGKSTNINGQWLNIKPNASLDKESEYYLELPVASLKNQEGTQLGNEISMAFTTNYEESDNVDTSPSTSSSSSKKSNQKLLKVDGQNIGKLSVSSHLGIKKGILKIDSKLFGDYLIDSDANRILLTADVDELEVSLLLSDIIELRNRGMDLQIVTGDSIYNFDPSNIDLDALDSDDYNQLSMRITITRADEKIMKAVGEAEERLGFKLVGNVLDFNVIIEQGDNPLKIEKFKAFSERLIKIASGFDKKRITAGVTIDDEGTLRQVPIRFVTIDGQDYVALYSMTNSAYMLIEHQVAYEGIDDSYAKEAIISLGQKYIIDDESKFEIKENVSRLELVKYIVKAFGLKPEETSRFEDIEKESEDAAYVGVAYNLGITEGTSETSFDPDTYVSREQAMTLIYRAAQLVALDEMVQTGQASKEMSLYEDYSMVSDYAIDAAKWNIERGLIIGTSSNTISPKDYLTKEQISMILYRFLEHTDFGKK